MKYKILRNSILSAAVLITLDVLFSFLSDKKVGSENFFLNQRLESATLGSGHDQRLDCQIDVMYYFYIYKTCFIRRTQKGIEDWSYRFVYARPFPIFMSFMNSFRFEMTGTGASNYIIFHDGTIEKVT